MSISKNGCSLNAWKDTNGATSSSSRISNFVSFAAIPMEQFCSKKKKKFTLKKGQISAQCPSKKCLLLLLLFSEIHCDTFYCWTPNALWYSLFLISYIFSHSWTPRYIMKYCVPGLRGTLWILFNSKIHYNSTDSWLPTYITNPPILYLQNTQ